MSGRALALGNRGDARAWTLPRVAWAPALVRLVLGAVFLLSGLAKLDAPYGFLHAVLAYEMLPTPAAVAIAAILPWLEVALGACLVVGLLTPGALALTVGLCVAFLYAQLHALTRELPIACGCFSLGAEQTVSYTTVLRTAILLALAAILLFHAMRRNSRADRGF